MVLWFWNHCELIWLRGNLARHNILPLSILLIGCWKTEQKGWSAPYLHDELLPWVCEHTAVDIHHLDQYSVANLSPQVSMIFAKTFHCWLSPLCLWGAWAHIGDHQSCRQEQYRWRTKVYLIGHRHQVDLQDHVHARLSGVKQIGAAWVWYQFFWNIHWSVHLIFSCDTHINLIITLHVELCIVEEWLDAYCLKLNTGIFKV